MNMISKRSISDFPKFDNYLVDITLFFNWELLPLFINFNGIIQLLRCLEQLKTYLGRIGIIC